jgi:hypothetical protein
VYPCFYVFGEAAVALLVGGMLHHQMTFLASVVCLVPLIGAPPLHHLIPALRMCARTNKESSTKFQVHDILEDKIKYI